jgi:hypothetical protein
VFRPIADQLVITGFAGFGRITLLATNGTDITIALKNIESSTEVLKSLRNDTKSGKGLAGTVFQNEQPSTTVQAIVNHLGVASSHLTRPGRWSFLRHKEPLYTPPDGTTATHNPTKP